MQPALNKGPEALGQPRKAKCILLGAACSYPRSQDICEEPHSSVSVITHRQYSSCSMYKQYGGNNLCRAGSSGSEPLDVVPGEEHTHHCPVSPWGSEYHNRCGVSDNSGLVRLEIESELILEDRSPLWSHRSAPICLQTHSSVSSLFQLVTRSLCNSDGRLSAGLLTGDKLCESPLGSDRLRVIASPSRLVLLAPVWKSQPWYQVLLGMLVDYSRLLPRDSQVMINRDPSILTPQLVVWRISGIDTEAISFRRKLWNSCSTPGEQRLTSLTTDSLGNGIAGVISKV